MVKQICSATLFIAGIFSGLSAGLSIACDFPPSGLLENPRVEFHKLYVNEVYGYRVAIPGNLTGYSQPAPSPQHGFGIVLGSHDDGYLYVSGDRNSLAYRRAVDGALELLTGLQKSQKSILSATITRVQLDRLSGVNVDVIYKCPAGSEVYEQSATIALSPDGENIFTITLYSHANPPEHYKDLLSDILKSWKYRPSG